MSEKSWLDGLPKFYRRQAKQLGVDRIGTSRRDFLKGLGAATAAGAGASVLPRMARGATPMGYACWEGYNAPSIVEPFEAANDVKMNIDVIIDDPSAFGKLIAGGHRDTDVVTLDAPWIQRMGPAGLCEYLDIADYEDTYANFYPEFAHPFEPLMDEGKITGLPTRWGWIGPMFNTNYTSWDYWKDYTPAFDPANRDKIAVMDFGDYPILIMAQHAGINPYVKLDNSEINEIRMVLRHLFENTRLLVGDLTLLQKGLVDGSIATGVGCGNYCVSGARYGGHMEITSRVPEPLDNGFKRGAIWLEATAIVTEPNNPEAAHNWIKWCADTEVCKILSLGDITSPPTPNKRVEALYSEEEKDIIMTDYMWEAWNNSLFQTMMPDVDELLAIFQEEWARAS
jgi:spermidine/putrescine transport system substrate-binding protein